MNEQVQCPNCGGYRVVAFSQITEKLPTKEYKPISPFWIWLIRIGFVVICFVAWGIPLLLLLSSDIRRLIFTGQVTMIGKVVGYNYSCGLCNYRWSWIIGTPKPEVHIQPDLIKRGMQKLQEEDEERRRRQD